MFIKYGEEQHLYNLMTYGEMFFNPCKYFRDLEEEQKQKGIGDGNDGSMTAPIDNAYAITPEGKRIELKSGKLSIIVEEALQTPIFCMRKVDSEFISLDYRKKLMVQFPKHTHALIIRNETELLENIRYKLRNKVFAHSVFYQDNYHIDFVQFLKNGSSDIRFYEPRRRDRYFIEVRYEPLDGSEKSERFFIDDTNFYKTMYRKDLYFSDQTEYRLVLPYEKIESGVKHYIDPPIKAELISLDALVKEGIC